MRSMPVGCTIWSTLPSGPWVISSRGKGELSLCLTESAAEIFKASRTLPLRSPPTNTMRPGRTPNIIRGTSNDIWTST